MKKAININYALHELRLATEPQLITYVRATGTRKGSISHIRCIYGYAKRSHHPEKPKPKPSGTYDRNKMQALIPVTDIDTGETKTLRIAHIIGFNDYIVKH